MRPTEENYEPAPSASFDYVGQYAYSQQDIDILFTTLEIELIWLIREAGDMPPIMRDKPDAAILAASIVDLWWSFHQESQCILHQKNRSIWERDSTLYSESNHSRASLIKRLLAARQLIGVERIESMRSLLDGEKIAIALLTIMIDYYSESLNDA